MPLAVATIAALPASHALGEATAPASDPVLNLLLEKGMITENEAAKVQAQVDSYHTNAILAMPPSKWKIGSNIKSVELYGDVRLRYEDRSAEDPSGGKIDLQRYRYSLRFGLRGEVFDDFYYGFRLETGTNPRSSMVTFGTSSSGTTYSGPFGKSQAGIAVGQIYLGWHPESWVDVTVGKMPNPLYTSAMVWSPSINPEGIAEHLKYTVGQADFFLNFGQFIYEDNTPSSTEGDLAQQLAIASPQDNIFQIAWQGGVNYHITTNMSAKVGATLYHYVGLQKSTVSGEGEAPYFGDAYVGEGAYTGPGSINPVYGYNGYGSGNALAGYQSVGYANNQVGLDDLLVLEVPFEFNFKISKLDAKVFGDVAYNIEGAKRAEKAAAGYAAYLGSQQTPSTTSAFAPQKNDDKAYQIGFALGSEGALGMVNGTTSKKHAWEARAYWQHVEQYSLDPNLLDTDFFNGLENLEGIYGAVAYGFTGNLIGTFRYGYATRINDKLGTGGSSTDIPQINPVNQLNILQVDLTLRF